MFRELESQPVVRKACSTNRVKVKIIKEKNPQELNHPHSQTPTKKPTRANVPHSKVQ